MSELLFDYKGESYPAYLKQGNAISYIMPVAKYFCKGEGLDIGGTFKWNFPGARIINIGNDDKWAAGCLPDEKYDYIISSHCLEHVERPPEILEYWQTRLKKSGVLFLYLPHPDMEYWAINCPKHRHYFYPKVIYYWLHDLGFKDILVSGRDMYWSFTVVAFNG